MNTPSIGRRLPGICFAIAALLLALPSIRFSFYPYGTAVWVRPLVSMTGIAGAVFLLMGIGWWRLLLSVWCAVQSIIVATDVSGEWFYQNITLGLFYKQEFSSTNNHLRMDYSASGFSTTGLVLLLILAIIMVAKLHPPVKRQFPGWKIALAVAGLAILIVSTREIILRYQANHATFVLEVKGIHVPIYYQGQLLGYSPLAVTPQRVAEWKLPLKPHDLKYMGGSGWADCVTLTDDQTEIPLFAGAPLVGAGNVDQFDTPWGKRCRMHVGREIENRRSGFFWPVAELRGDPIVTISLKPGVPVVAGRPFQLHCVLSNPTSFDYEGSRSELTRFCRSFGPTEKNWTPPPASLRRTIALPESWNTLKQGARFEMDVEFDAPLKPEEYELFCPWFLYKKGKNGESGSGSAYSNVLLLRVEPDQVNPASTTPAR